MGSRVFGDYGGLWEIYLGGDYRKMILREIFLEFIIDKKEYNINEKDTL